MKIRYSWQLISTSFSWFHSQENLNSVLFVVALVLFNFLTNLMSFNIYLRCFIWRQIPKNRVVWYGYNKMQRNKWLHQKYNYTEMSILYQVLILLYNLAVRLLYLFGFMYAKFRDSSYNTTFPYLFISLFFLFILFHFFSQVYLSLTRNDINKRKYTVMLQYWSFSWGR